jgi:tRNA pseudouridine32 synthase / 23S rRNA pseudouridine746 synthase
VNETDETVFRYRYNFAPENLKSFLTRRFMGKRPPEMVAEILRTRVRLNGASVDDDTVIDRGDWIEYRHFRSDESVSSVDLDILYEDQWLVAISKPDFLPVIPNTGYYFNTMSIIMKERYPTHDINPVHRLDLETGGVLLFGKSTEACSRLQRLFQSRQIEKHYQAVVLHPPAVDRISGRLIPDTQSRIYTKRRLIKYGDHNATTLILRQEAWGEYYRLWLKPLSGQLNQIRAQLAAIGSPIVGDKKYYPDERVFLDWIEHRDINRLIDRLKINRQALFAESLQFSHPFTAKTVTIKDNTGHWDKKIHPILSKPYHRD